MIDASPPPSPQPAPLERVAPLVISAPFGNYIRARGATSTLGTFTVLRRPGRVWRVLKTVRYHRKLRAWTNRIGLRNPGIGWLEQKVKLGRVSAAESIISIHGFDAAQWRELVERAAALKPIAIELNLSCPNVGEVSWPQELFKWAISAGAANGVGVIAKVPPVRYEEMVRAALADGVRGFHCCNTIPVPAGGMSGKPLLPMSLECIGRVREVAAERGVLGELRIIGGGGVTSPAEVVAYSAAGAWRVAIGTKAMNPRLLWTDKPIRELVAEAGRRFG